MNPALACARFNATQLTRWYLNVQNVQTQLTLDKRSIYGQQQHDLVSMLPP